MAPTTGEGTDRRQGAGHDSTHDAARESQQRAAHDGEHEASGVVAAAESVAESVVRVVKPRLRGWLHAGMAPVAAVAGTILVVLAPTPTARWSTAVFAAATTLLFTASAVYHRGTWSPRTTAALRRLDHSNIFLVIAGTFTPLAALLLEPPTSTILLLVIWGGAVAGILARVFWLRAPRWFYVPVYLALGWVAVGYLPQFWSDGHHAIVWFVAIGGLAYTLGAVVYGLKRPNPSPRWFGFHEIFHVLTVIGYGCHFVAVAIASAGAA